MDDNDEYNRAMQEEFVSAADDVMASEYIYTESNYADKNGNAQACC